MDAHSRSREQVRKWAVSSAVAAGLVPAALFLVRGSLDESGGLWFLGRLLYWSMPVLLLLAVAAGIWRLREAGFRTGELARRHGTGLALALGLSAACVALVPAEMRVQWDESNLESSAFNMHTQRSCFVTIGAVPFEGEPLPIELMVDKRPPLFPFLVSALHDLSGFRLANAFAVNALVLFLLLALVHAATRNRTDRTTAHIAAPLLVLSVPMAVVGATSAGFELMAVLLFAAVWLAAVDLARDPTMPRLGWLLAAGVLFSYTRYESFAVFGFVLALAMWTTRTRWRWWGRPLALCCALPAAFAPLALQLLHSTDLDFYSESQGAALVSFGNAVGHLPGFLAESFDPRPTSPFAGVLTWLAVAVAVAKTAGRRWTTQDMLLSLPVLAGTGIALAWFYSDAHEPSAQRLFLPSAILAAVAPLWLWKSIPKGLPALALLVGIAGFAALRVQQVRARAAFPKLEVVQRLEAVEASIAGLQDPGTTLLVSSVAQYLALKGWSAVSPETFGRQHATIEELRRRRHVREVLLVETPLDERLAARHGSLHALMRGYVTEITSPAGAAVVVHRLRGRRF